MTDSQQGFMISQPSPTHQPFPMQCLAWWRAEQWMLFTSTLARILTLSPNTSSWMSWWNTDENQLSHGPGRVGSSSSGSRGALEAKVVPQVSLLRLCRCRMENGRCFLPPDGIWQLCTYTRLVQGDRNWIDAQGTAKPPQDLTIQIISSKGCWGHRGKEHWESLKLSVKWEERINGCQPAVGAGDKDKRLWSWPLTLTVAVAWHKTSPIAARERLGTTAGASRGLRRSQAELHFHRNLFTHRRDEIQTGELSRVWNQWDHSLFSAQLKVQSQPTFFAPWLEWAFQPPSLWYVLIKTHSTLT